MKGLLKSNLFAVLADAKIYMAEMLLLGVAAIILGKSLVIISMLLGLVGFPLNSATSLRKQNASKWSKHILTAPVKRSEIIKSYFVSQLLWLLVGALYAAIVAGLSMKFQGIPFDRNIDILMVFTLGIGVTLFKDSVFFPLFSLFGEERSEIILGISLVVAVSANVGLICCINALFGSHMTTAQLVYGAMILLGCATFVFSLSYPLAIWIFKKREF